VSRYSVGDWDCLGRNQGLDAGWFTFKPEGAGGRVAAVESGAGVPLMCRNPAGMLVKVGEGFVGSNAGHCNVPKKAGLDVRYMDGGNVVPDSDSLEGIDRVL
jgi:hypothetical protein